MLRQLAITFLRSTSKGPLNEALPEEPKGPVSRLLHALRLPALFKGVGRFVGSFLSPKAKARIQDFLINTFRIPVDLNPGADALEGFYRKSLAHLRERLGADGIGDYLEFGVYQGTSLLRMHQALEAEGLAQVRLFGFDSFEGLPEGEGVWSEGQYAVDLEFTRQRLDEAGVDWKRTFLVKGFFSDTLTPELLAEHGIRKASIIMVDSDLYSSAVEALTYCEPLIHDEAVVLFDDWHSTAEGEGEQRAFTEFLEAHPSLEAEDFGTYLDNARVFLVRRV